MTLSPDQLFERLQAQADSQQRPPVQDWHPDRVGHINIVIDATGQWWHDGSRFQRQSLVRLFAQILRREGNEFYLVTPVEKLQIKVEDAPFIATDLQVRGEPGSTDLLFTTNVDDVVMADAGHPVSIRNEKPYCVVRDGLEAKLSTAVYYQMAQYAVCEQEKGQDTYKVYSQGSGFSLN